MTNKDQTTNLEGVGSTVGLGQTATAISTEYFEVCRAYNRLCMYPEQQAKAIALHYAAHYQLARELLALIDARERSTVADNAIVDDCIAYLVTQIKENHRKEFGIELEWPNAKVSGGGTPSAGLPGCATRGDE